MDIHKDTEIEEFEYLTSEQTADLLAVTTTTLYRWKKTGRDAIAKVV